ncbi:MAG: hypothetical protein AMJ84_12255 [Acidithiobacillales bacterium SM23_46]|nr:MAG: hypothetical protein AMJ84_12255 [Acidithiobacillales bacterium SM23_46]KPL27964.1 MAG: hypothetical protein AMJ72_05870 [Acidithiobacillales bacterium SM1_46]
MAVTGTPVSIASAPVSLDEAKKHLRVTQTDEDTLIETLILVATAHAEQRQGRTYMQTQKVLQLDEFPTVIEPPGPPLLSVQSIQYIDIDGQTQTVDAADYQVDTYNAPGRIKPAYEKSWPATRSVLNAVTVNYTAGYGEASAVPVECKQAILLLVGHLFEHRESVSELKLQEVPQAVAALLGPKKVYTL